MRTLAALTAVVLLSACGSSSDHNDADVAFAQKMVPHHEQAIEMSRLVAGADAGPDVRELAAQIAKAQGPEIKTMKSWLKKWDAAASEDHGDMNMEHGSGSGDEGMMSKEQMADLDQATRAEFDRLWLTLMIEHHEGAITMAEREMRDGTNAEAIDLAKKIVDGQAAEIDRMKELLDE